ncbi:hypothetical protein DYQ86_20085 [Acidobacteria bacterium AB60]|nr:hypothetical protein DYQ86_20085 [Acidobacteria bacterium AB60]
MDRYTSGPHSIEIEQFEPQTPGPHSALMVLHGTGGAAYYWMERFAPALSSAGVAMYAPHYFDKTGTARASMEMILDGRHFAAWLSAVRDALNYVAERPAVDPERIGVLGISLGGYLAIALGIEDPRIRAIVELSGGVPWGWEPRIHSRMPPTLVLHGAADQIVPLAEAHKLQALLEEHRVPHEVEIFAGETHWFVAGAQIKLLTKTLGFLSQHLFNRGSLRKAG